MGCWRRNGRRLDGLNIICTPDVMNYSTGEYNKNERDTRSKKHMRDFSFNCLDVYKDVNWSFRANVKFKTHLLILWHQNHTLRVDRTMSATTAASTRRITFYRRHVEIQICENMAWHWHRAAANESNSELDFCSQWWSKQVWEVVLWKRKESKKVILIVLLVLLSTNWIEIKRQVSLAQLNFNGKYCSSKT